MIIRSLPLVLKLFTQFIISVKLSPLTDFPAAPSTRNPCNNEAPKLSINSMSFSLFVRLLPTLAACIVPLNFDDGCIEIIFLYPFSNSLL